MTLTVMLLHIIMCDLQLSWHQHYNLGYICRSTHNLYCWHFPVRPNNTFVSNSGGPDKHQETISIRHKSWFAGSNMTLEEIVQLTYWWAQGVKQKQLRKEVIFFFVALSTLTRFSKLSKPKDY